jgi:hypothetical protein
MRGIRLADLFERQHVRECVHAHTAILLRDLDAHKAHLTHFSDGRVRKLPALVELSGNRNDLVLRKITGGIAQHLVLFAEGKQGNV